MSSSGHPRVQSSDPAVVTQEVHGDAGNNSDAGSTAVHPPQEVRSTPDPSRVHFTVPTGSTADVSDLSAGDRKTLDELLAKLRGDSDEHSATRSPPTREATVFEIGHCERPVIGAAVPALLDLLEHETDPGCQVAEMVVCMRAEESFPGGQKARFEKILSSRFLASDVPEVRSTAKLGISHFKP